MGHSGNLAQNDLEAEQSSKDVDPGAGTGEMDRDTAHWLQDGGRTMM